MNLLPQASGNRPRLACEISPQGVVAARAETALAPLAAVARVTLAPGAAELRVMGLNAMSPARWADVVEIAAKAARRRLQGPEATSVLDAAIRDHAFDRQSI